MFAYNPTVNDRSGEFLGAGKVASAQTMADAKVKLVDDIGSSLVSWAGAYASNKGMQAEAEGYDRIGEILGGSMFKDNPAVGGYLADLRKQKNPQMKIAGYNALFGLAGPMSNAMMSQRNAGIRENAPFVNVGLDNARDLAGGKGTFVPGGDSGNIDRSGMPPVEPDLPIGDDFLPPVQRGAGMQNNITRFAPSQKSVSAAQNWSAGYFGKSNP
jgi:hypothetical protein